MEEDFWKLVTDLAPGAAASQAEDAARSREKRIKILLRHKKIPDTGWPDELIEIILGRLSMMDSNNFPSNVGVGEREGRVASVARRNFNFVHGIGRSGDLTETQPKAQGSSVLYKLTHFLLRDLCCLLGFKSQPECLLVPVATGMSLVLCMLTLRKQRPNAKYVIWSRIDQKSCFKSIVTAGFVPIIIDTIPQGDKLSTDLLSMERKMVELGPDNVLCVMSTTSCFAPRIPDDIEGVAKLCKHHDVPHLINNAYGLQSVDIVRRIDRANRNGRVDLIVQSTDKNLMVPVGGAIIIAFNKALLDAVGKSYPGRASAAPVIDVFITLLALGKNGIAKLLDERLKMFVKLSDGLRRTCADYGEKLLETYPENPISLAVTLSTYPQAELTKLGSEMFVRNVSGMRVINLLDHKTMDGYTFKGWGGHSDQVTTPYLTCAASIGAMANDIETFLLKLNKLFDKHKRKTL